jgi:hypothetical protein
VLNTKSREGPAEYKTVSTAYKWIKRASYYLSYVVDVN